MPQKAPSHASGPGELSKLEGHRDFSLPIPRDCLSSLNCRLGDELRNLRYNHGILAPQHNFVAQAYTYFRRRAAKLVPKQIRSRLVSLVAIQAMMSVSANAGSGGTTYSAQCAMCHQTSGSGLSGQFPRLNGRTVELARTPESRRYVVMVLLYGMYGKIVVDGKPLSGVMPTMGMLSDQQIADVLNHTLQLGRAGRPPPPFTAIEVSKVRAAGRRTSADVAAERVRLVGKGLIPK